MELMFLVWQLKKNNSKGYGLPDCSFMPIQIGSETNPGMFTMNSIIDGVLYGVNNGADVINLSIQSIYPDELNSLQINN